MKKATQPVPTKKLTLAKETLRRLEEADKLQQVVAGIELTKGLCSRACPEN
jgi:hypothetical protein